MCLIFEGINYYIKAHGKLLRLNKILGLIFPLSFFVGVFRGILCHTFLAPKCLAFLFFQRSCFSSYRIANIQRKCSSVDISNILPFSFETTLLLSDTWCRCFRSIIFIFGERGIIFLVFFWRYGCF